MRQSVPRVAAREKWPEIVYATGGAAIFSLNPPSVLLPCLSEQVAISHQPAWL